MQNAGALQQVGFMKNFYRPILLCTLTCLSHLAHTKDVLPILWNVPRESDTFYGRAKDLQDAKIRIRRNPLLVTGRSGIGKTSFAFHYARASAPEYQVVWVLNVNKGIEDQIIDFANKLAEISKNESSFKKYEEALDYVKTTLRLSPFGWLLIIDNAASLQSVIDIIPETHGAKNKHVLVTSLSPGESSQTLSLDALQKTEACAFLTHHLPTAEPSDIECLADMLESHPLAMLQAASYIKATPSMDIKSYITFFNENKKRYWASEEKALTESTHPLLFKTIKVSLDQLRASSLQSYHIFCFLCLLDAQGVERHLVEQVYTSVPTDPAEFSRVLSLSLMTQDAFSDNTSRYRIQEYTKNVVRYSLTAEDLRAASHIGLKLFKALLSGDVRETAQIFKKQPLLAHHVKSFLSQADLNSYDEVIEIAVKLFFYTYYYLRDDAACLEISDIIRPYVRSGKVSQLPYLVMYQCLDSYMTALKEGVPAALKELSLAKAGWESLKKKEQALMPSGADIPRAYYAYLQGNKVVLNTTLFHLMQATQDERTSDRLFCDELTLYLLDDQGKTIEALALVNQILESSYQKKDTHTQAHLLMQTFKIMLLVKANRVEEADSLSQEVEKSLGNLQTLGKDTELLARFLMALSLVQTTLHRNELAEMNVKKSIEIMEKLFMGREKRRLQALAHTVLGGIYRDRKHYKEALAEYTFAERIYEKICTHKDFDDMSDLYHRFVTLGLLMNDSNVVRKGIFSHKESFDTLHPRYLEMTKLTLKAGIAL